MKSIATKNISNYVIPVIIFFFIALAYFIPDILERRNLSQHDIVQHKGMSKEITDFREQYGEEALWTNSMFGGMPAYLISTQYKSNICKFIHRVFTLNNFRPVCFIFLYLTGAYIALLLFGIHPWLSFAGAVAYAFSSYFLIIITAGHVSKVFALGYMPPIIAGVYAAYRGKILLGSIVTGVFLGLQIVVNHLQITYYTFLIILVFGIIELVNAIRSKTIKDFLKPLPWLAIFVILAIGANFSTLWTTYEYGKYSIRGQSELTTDLDNKTSGLDRDYVTQYSYGIGETMTLLIPDFKGGSSVGSLKTNSHTYDFIKNNYGASEAKRFVSAVPLYWGDQIQTAGPVYVGAVVIFLFVLGLFIIKKPVKWWFLVVTIISIILAWGRHLPAVTNFMLDYFPGYNKFRTVSMTLIMAEFAMPVLALLTIREIITGNIPKKEFLKAFKYTLYGLGGLILLMILVAGSFDMTAPGDAQYRAQGMSDVFDMIVLDRLKILRQDAFRSLVFICLTAALVYFTYLKKLKFNAVVVLLSVLFLADLWPIDKRYLNSDDFVPKKEYETPFTASTADLVILQDKEPDFRVLNVSLSPLQDASTSYFHKSLGGYHGAKMMRYQELYDHCIINEITSLYMTLQKQPSLFSIDSTLATLNAINMLNTRYIIFDPEAPPMVNKNELGNAWFVNEILQAANADEEIATINAFDPAYEAVVDQRFNDELKGLTIAPDTNAKISLTEYFPNHLTYASSSSTEQFAVFSEIYYPKGWQAYIDGEPTSHIRADYVLRAMRIPAGNHIIEFKFHPASYYTGEKVSLTSSVVLILLLLGIGYREWKLSRKKD